MRLVLVATLLAGSFVHAQVVRPLGETPGDPGPAFKTLDEPVKPSGNGAERFSTFSAGQGGPLFAFSEIAGGMTLGAVIGTGLTGSSDTSSIPLGVYVGALTGGVVLGSLGVALQHVRRIGLVASGASSLGLVVGALAGFGAGGLLRSSFQGPAVLPGLLALVGSQAGAFLPLALSWATDDLEPGDFALMGAGALHGLALTGLVTLALNLPLSAPAMLIAPAVGMLAAGLVAAVTRFSISVVLLQALPAFGVALAAFFASAAFMPSLQGAALIGLGSMAASVGVTALIAASAPAPDALEVTPTLAVLPQQGLAPVVMTPALVGRF